MHKNILKDLYISICLFCLITFTQSAFAISLDFSGFTLGNTFTDNQVVPYSDNSGTATLDNSFFSGGIVFSDSNFTPNPPVFCFLQQFGCGSNGAILFSSAIEDLSFVVEQTSTFSNVVAQIHGPDGLIDTLFWNDIAGTGRTRIFDFGDAGPITSVRVSSINDIAFYGNFNFNTVAPIPVPSAFVLMLSAIMSTLSIKRLRS